MTSQPPSQASTRKARPHNKRGIQAALILGGLLILLLLGLGLTRANQSAINSLVRQANSKVGSEREKELKALSITTGHNDTVQAALGEYYGSIQQPKLAGEAYASGSDKLADRAMASFIQAGEYASAQKVFTALPTRARGTNTLNEAATVEFNLSNIDTGCKYADQAQTASAQEACKLLQQSDSTRKNAYRLAELKVFTKAQSLIEAQANKAAGDYRMLIGMKSQQGKLDQAGDLYVVGLKQFPADRELAQQGSDFCRQSRGVKACSTITPLAETILTQTKFAQ